MSDSPLLKAPPDDASGLWLVLPMPKTMAPVPPEEILWTPVWVYPQDHRQAGLARLLMAKIDDTEFVTLFKLRASTALWCRVEVPDYRHPPRPRGVEEIAKP